MHIPTVHIRPPKINWHRYFERRVLVMLSFVVFGSIVDQFVHYSVVHKIHELALGAFFEHVTFGVMFED